MCTHFLLKCEFEYIIIVSFRLICLVHCQSEKLIVEKNDRKIRKFSINCTIKILNKCTFPNLVWYKKPTQLTCFHQSLLILSINSH